MAAPLQKSAHFRARIDEGNNMNEIFQLFQKNFFGVRRSEEKIKLILADEKNKIIRVEKNNALVGVSVINENTIYLLCVDAAFQNRGIGSDLLKQSEDFVFSKGFEKIILGAGKDYIVPGVPMNKNAHEFFKKRGYIHSWESCGCFDMFQSLADFFCENSVGDTIGGVTFRWANKNDIDGVIFCVKDAYESFAEYYQDKRFYEKNNDVIVLIAVQCHTA